jgi:hypothetical protein
MAKKHFAAIFIITMVTVLMVACCEDWDEQKCLDEHGTLMRKSECPAPPSTPIIILELKPGGGNATQWTVQQPGGSPEVQDDSEVSMFSDCTTCTLRDDFIGAKVLAFDYLPDGGTEWVQATKIVAKKDNIKMEITRSFNNIYYRVEDSSSGPCWCVAYSSLPIDTGEVPSELYEFDADDIKHISGGTEVDVESVRIQPYVLN